MTDSEPAAEQADGPITKPGVYAMDAGRYHRDPVLDGSLSSTGARRLMPPSCPAKFDHERRNGRPDTAAFDLGRAAHARVLGVGDPIKVIAGSGKDPNSWNTNETKKAVAEARAAGFTPIKPEDEPVLDGMVAELRATPDAMELLHAGDGAPEQVLVWQDAESGVWCRAMLDWLPQAWPGEPLQVVDYKGLATDTAIPTPTGWTTMGALSVGDEVFGADGTRCTVTAKSDVHWRTCYRITFDDRSAVICDDEHLWHTISGQSMTGRGARSAVLTTEQIRATLKGTTGQCHHRIPLAGALDLPDAELIADPYVLGCWLGDGSVGNGRISKPDDELFAAIKGRGYEVGQPPPATMKRGCPTRTVYGLSAQLRRLGVLNHKSIPDVYLRASRAQRADLLRGLMDTDGYWNKARSEAQFTSTDKGLAEQVCELACSLGQRAVVHEYVAHGFGKTITAYKVNFTPMGLNPFSLSRKAELVRLGRVGQRSSRRLVMSVAFVPTVPTQCITVDSPDSTYLCTESMIPTHNTTTCAEPGAVAKHCADFGYAQQAAWYLDGVLALDLHGGVMPQFTFIFQEKAAPYLVTVVDIDPDDIEMARVQNRKARDVYRQCVETGHWPSYTSRPVTVSLPGWHRARLDAAHRNGDFDTLADLSASENVA